MLNIYLYFYPIYAIGCTLLLLFGLFFIINWTKFENQHLSDAPNIMDNKYWTTINVAAALFFIFCLICGILDAIHLHLCLNDNISMLSAHYEMIKVISLFLYFTATAMFNIILFLRLYLVFKQSIYALNASTIFCVLCQICFSVILIAFNCILNIHWHDNAPAKLGLTIFVVMMINDLIVSVLMVYLFCFKLQKLIKARQDSASMKVLMFKQESLRYSSMDLSYKLALFKERKPHKSISIQKNFQNSETLTDERSLSVVMTRHSLLNITAICFNQLFYALLVCYYIIELFDDPFWKLHTFGVFLYGLRIWGMVGISSCILLGMTIGKDSYFKCCWICHLQCFKCCVACTKYDDN